jgi:glycerol-3-phosphate dehydrogenase
MSVESPEDTQVTTAEVEYLMRIGELTFEHLRGFRILRAFCGSRPLYTADASAKGRGVSRGFVILDHEHDGLKGFASICGGKFTTYRLMAEKMADLVCGYLKNTTACRTAEEALVPDIDAADIKEARKYFPSFGVNLAASRLGQKSFKNVIKRMEAEPLKREIVCECENVTMAEIEEVVKTADTATTYTLSDVRRKTRMGMGTCQGAFCTFRSMGMIAQNDLMKDHDTIAEMKNFLQARYKGISPVMWGNTVREVELMRGIYDGVLNLDGGMA